MRSVLGRTALMAVLLSGCAAFPSQQPLAKKNAFLKPFDKVIDKIDDAHYFVTPSSRCEPANIYYVDETTKERRLVIDWSAYGDRDTFTLTLPKERVRIPARNPDDMYFGRMELSNPQKRQLLVDRIQRSGRGCHIPYLISADQGPNVSHDNGKTWKYWDTFTLFWIDADAIYLKAVAVNVQNDGKAHVTLTSPQPTAPYGWWEPSEESGDDWKPYDGPKALPQIAYRIDENRFFEIVPREQFSCDRATVYYTDKTRGIHKGVMPYRIEDGEFVIDAATDDYLIAPILISSSGCQTGDGASHKCDERLPYSTDGGKSWKFHIATCGGDLYLVEGKVFCQDLEASLSEFTEDYTPEIWHDSVKENFLKKLRKPPLDNQFHCTPGLAQ